MPHFQQIVSGVLMLPCTMAAVFYFLCSQLVGRWSFVGRQSTIRVPGLWEVSLQKDNNLVSDRFVDQTPPSSGGYFVRGIRKTTHFIEFLDTPWSFE